VEIHVTLGTIVLYARHSKLLRVPQGAACSPYSDKRDEMSVDVFLSVADAAKLLGVTPATVRLMIRTGKLAITAKTEGGIQLFRREEVERLARVRAERLAAAG
jgi:excisionase family DNA binding protein